MSDHRNNIVKKLGLPEWVANTLHEICPRKESFLLAKYVRDEAVRKGYCNASAESVKRGFYTDFSMKFKMPHNKNTFGPDDLHEIIHELHEMKERF